MDSIGYVRGLCVKSGAKQPSCELNQSQTHRSLLHRNTLVACTVFPGEAPSSSSFILAR